VIEIGYRDIGAFGREEVAHGPSDAGRSTDHKCLLMLQPIHASAFFC
jgi:hypothetical protein